jgi:hypothetical protein
MPIVNMDSHGMSPGTDRSDCREGATTYCTPERAFLQVPPPHSDSSTDTKSAIESVPFSAVWKWTFRRRQHKSFWGMWKTDLKRLQSALLKMVGGKLLLKTVTLAAAALYRKRFTWDADTLKFVKQQG